MDVSNSTGQDTQYRVGNGGTKILVNNWQPLATQSTRQCSDPQGPWTIEFQLPDGTILSATFEYPKAAVTLESNGNHYKIKAVKTAA